MFVGIRHALFSLDLIEKIPKVLDIVFLAFSGYFLLAGVLSIVLRYRRLAIVDATGVTLFTGIWGEGKSFRVPWKNIKSATIAWRAITGTGFVPVGRVEATSDFVALVFELREISAPIQALFSQLESRFLDYTTVILNSEKAELWLTPRPRGGHERLLMEIGKYMPVEPVKLHPVKAFISGVVDFIFSIIVVTLAVLTAKAIAPLGFLP